jgi:hypothetical protein
MLHCHNCLVEVNDTSLSTIYSYYIIIFGQVPEMKLHVPVKTDKEREKEKERDRDRRTEAVRMI